MITIDQLLESVDLDFEPRWVTKNKNGYIYIWGRIPYRRSEYWTCDGKISEYVSYNHLKLAEFENKDWQECIYEVSHNDIDYERIKLDMEETIKQLDKLSAKLDTIRELMTKKGLIKVDAVNELKENKGV